jgi:hypothetical protein
MKRTILMSTVLALSLGVAQPLSAQTAPIDLVRAAVEAQGGADALRAIKTLVVKGDAMGARPVQQHQG